MPRLSLLDDQRPLSLKVTGEPVSAVTVAVKVLAPTTPGVAAVCASPLASVTDVEGLTLPPPTVAAQVTVTPCTGVRVGRDTNTTSGLGTGVPTFAL